MVPPSSVAAALAVLPTEHAPLVIQQFSSTFLVSGSGEAWRVYDSATPDGADRRMPSAGSTLPHRLFLGLARKSEVRVYTFAPSEPREVDPVSLQEQLDNSASGLVRAAGR